MDLIGQLSQQLGVNGTQAQGLAGSLLKLVQGTVKEKLGPEASDQMGQAIPEMEGWQQAPSTTSAPQTAPDAGGGLMGALGNLMSGQEGGTGGMMSALGQAGDVAAVVSLLGRFNIDPSKASLVAPLLLNFLKSRLDPALVGRILSVVPLLSGGGGGGGGSSPGGGGLGGLLGGLMGGGR